MRFQNFVPSLLFNALYFVPSFPLPCLFLSPFPLDILGPHVFPSPKKITASSFNFHINSKNSTNFMLFLTFHFFIFVAFNFFYLYVIIMFALKQFRRNHFSFMISGVIFYLQKLNQPKFQKFKFIRGTLIMFYKL